MNKNRPTFHLSIPVFLNSSSLGGPQVGPKPAPPVFDGLTRQHFEPEPTDGILRCQGVS